MFLFVQSLYERQPLFVHIFLHSLLVRASCLRRLKRARLFIFVCLSHPCAFRGAEDGWAHGEGVMDPIQE